MLVELDPVGLGLAVAKTPKEMLRVEIVEGKTKVRINSSSLSILQTCPRKAYYSLERKISPKQEASATLFGSAIHAALETFYSANKSERILPPNMNKTLELMAFGATSDTENDFLVYRATRKFIDRAEPLKSLPPEDKRSLANGVWILGHYFNSWIDDPYTVYVDKDGPFTERTLEAALYSNNNLEITLFGTIDVVMQNTANDELLVADHKTSSIVGKDFYNRLKPNHQYTGYLWLANKVLGLDLDRFMVNCIEVKSKGVTGRAAKPNFPRQITTRTQEDFREFEQTVLYYVEQYLYWRKTNFFPVGPVDACANYGACTYLNVCSSPQSIRENIISAEYNQGDKIEAI